MQLVWPAEEYLPSYKAALQRGWSPDTTRAAAAKEELERIDENPAHFLSLQIDREARGGPVRLPDGSMVPRLPGFKMWIWDGEFCGSLGFRWQPGTTDLPPHCLGHVGFSVVPWKRRQGYATNGLRLFLREVEKEGLPFVELTTDVDNIGSQRVITANGGELVEHFVKPAAYNGREALRYRIYFVKRA